ncbi:hypothetical protein T07_5348 [Trichinella nelsoni]|uniref:Uncharacterized protein n=1 Tax=Trichinella nelsoni TaxID=6336 RepID=A0A0V0RVY2_9BILA|nr:hypothetical protein T07_5348 [Trichinella nelsoni]
MLVAIAINNFIMIYYPYIYRKEYREQFAVEQTAAESTLLLRVKRERRLMGRWLGISLPLFLFFSTRKRCFSRRMDRINFHLHHHLVDFFNFGVCSFWPSVNHRVDLVPWDFLFLCWNGLTDRTSCFDRKLCTDWSWLCETSRFCSTETGLLCSLSFVIVIVVVVVILKADFSAANITD